MRSLLDREVVSLDAFKDVDTTTDAPQVGDSLVFDGTNWVTNMTQLAKEVDFDGVYAYIGEALPGTITTASTWRIKRVEFVAGTDDSITLFEDGDAAFDNQWSTRLAGSYS